MDCRLPRHPSPVQAIGQVIADANAQLAAINARSNWAAQLTAAHQRRNQEEPQCDQM